MSRQPPTSANAFDGLEKDAVKAAVTNYHDFHDECAGGDSERRKRYYTTMVNLYYDLVTDFYEFGWGQSFHFAPRKRGESFKASLARYERYLSEQLDLRSGMDVLDLGCGVGGPMREIARHSGASIAGINNNAYQVERANTHNRSAGLDQRCTLIKGDFMQIPVDDEHFDAVYAIEAIPHAPDRETLFREIYRVMKPGAGFAGYDWCLTEFYDEHDPEHRRIRKNIEEGTGLPELADKSDVVLAFLDAGFELIASRDVAVESDPHAPWYRALQGRDLTLMSLPRTPLGRAVTNRVVRTLEALRLAPQGTTAVSTLLNDGADALVEAGETGIFTPMFYFHVCKPT